MVGLDRLTNGQGVAGHEHIVKGNISLPVRGSTLYESHRDLRQLVVEELLPVHLHVFHKRVVNREPVDTRSFLSRVYKNIKPHLGERPRQSSRLRADGVGDTSKGQVICLKAVLKHQLLCA